MELNGRAWARAVPIPPDALEDYRLRVVFDACKWDPRVEDTDTIAPFALILSEPTITALARLAEGLDRETDVATQALWEAPETFHALGLPRPLASPLRKLARAEALPAGIKLRRYDFHPTAEGWRISEVNADVPGGFAEASLLPRLASEAGLKGGFPPDLATLLAKDLGEALRDRPSGIVALVHATAYADDRQVMTFLQRVLATAGLEGAPCAPDHLAWTEGPARLARLRERPVAALLRFFPAEWLPHLPCSRSWRPLLGGRGVDPLLCAPGAAVLAQSKRAPLLWRRLGLRLPTWERLLPECAEPDPRADDAWLHKPAYGRVGADIVAPAWEASPEDRKRLRLIRWFPRNWVRQRRFQTVPLALPDGQAAFACLGVFVLNGRFAGVYARTAPRPLIDHRAMDTPVLTEAPAASRACPSPLHLIPTRIA